MRVVLVVNPIASTTTVSLRTRVTERLRSAHDVEVRLTDARGHATALAREAAREGADVVAVLGGDGTMNEAAAGLLGTTTAVAPVQGGSTNVYARTIGYAHRVEAAMDQLMHALHHRSTRRVNPGLAGGRPFLFHLGAGFDAQVIARMERRNRAKRHLPHTMYAVSTVETFLRKGRAGRPRIEVATDDGSVVTSPYVIVSKTSPYTYFGTFPLVITPSAGLDRDLAVTAFRELTSVRLVGALGSAIRGGARLATDARFVQLGDLRRLTLTAFGAPFPWQVDGEHLGDAERLEVTVSADALTLVVPVTS